MLSHFASRGLSVSVVTVVWAVAASPAVSATPQGTWETPFQDAYPADTTTSHNYYLAGTRHADPSNSSPVITFWNLKTTGNPPPPKQAAVIGPNDPNLGAIYSGNRTDLANSWGYKPSDQIEMNNVRSLSIGSAVSANQNQNQTGYDDETYIEVVDTSVATPVLLKQFVLNSNQPIAEDWAREHAGLTNDLAITRDGGWGCVNASNWLYLIDIGNPQGPNGITGFNIGKYDFSQIPEIPWQPIIPCSPNGAVDSVAVTIDKAVFTTAHKEPSGRVSTWVYIVELASKSIVLQYQIPNLFTTEVNDYPHDVSITPNEEMAFVTTTKSQALFDLINYQPLGFVTDPDLSRSYQGQVDSVELTDKQAVVISDHTAGGGLTQWHVDVWDINLGTLLQNSTRQEFADPGTGESHAHDLDIDKALDKAVVRTSYDNVIFTNLLGTPLYQYTLNSYLPVAPYTPVSDAWAYKQFNTLTNFYVFSSDSVAISPPLGTTEMAATIGGYRDGNYVYHSVVDLIDLATVPPTLTSRLDIASGSGALGAGCVPVDLVVTQNHQELIVRSADPYQDPGIAGADLYRVSLVGGPNYGYGGWGYTMAQDSIAVPASGVVNTVRRLLSVSSDPDGLALGNGYVHTVP